MNRIIVTCLLMAAVCACTVEGAQEKRSLFDMAAQLYSSAWSTFLPDSTKETCRGLGWVDGPNARRRRDVVPILKKRGVLDYFVPKSLAHAMGAVHQGVFPPSMEAAFCTTAGMVKPGGQVTSTAEQITGVWADYGSQKVLVTPQGQVYDTAANYLGSAPQLGLQNYMG